MNIPDPKAPAKETPLTEEDRLRAEVDRLTNENNELNNKLNMVSERIRGISKHLENAGTLLNELSTGGILDKLALIGTRYSKLTVISPDSFRKIIEANHDGNRTFNCIVDRLNPQSSNVDYAIRTGLQDAASNKAKNTERTIKRVLRRS